MAWNFQIGEIARFFDVRIEDVFIYEEEQV